MNDNVSNSLHLKAQIESATNYHALCCHDDFQMHFQVGTDHTIFVYHWYRSHVVKITSLTVCVEISSNINMLVKQRLVCRTNRFARHIFEGTRKTEEPVDFLSNLFSKISINLFTASNSLILIFLGKFLNFDNFMLDFTFQ